jgi:hypothetical protein
MDLAFRDLTADELECVVGGDMQHGIGSGEDICARWFENGNGVICLVVYGPCNSLYR